MKHTETKKAAKDRPNMRDSNRPREYIQAKVKNIQLVLEYARQFGVSKLKMGDIEIEFFAPLTDIRSPQNDMGLQATADLPKTRVPAAMQASSGEKYHSKLENLDSSLLSDADKELFEDNMLLMSDPVGLEERIIGEMEGREREGENYTGLESVI